MVAPSRIQACAVVAFLTVVSTASAKYSGGRGVPNDPYQIATAADLIALGETPNDYDKHFILTADIDLDPNLPGGKVFDRAIIAWTRGSPGGMLGTPFTGTFDGAGHTVMHLTMADGHFLGLFGRLASGGKIENTGIMDAYVSGTYSGPLVARNDGGDVLRCHSTGVVNGTGNSVGGLVGGNRGSLTDCYSTCTVSGHGDVGGLVGENDGTVTTSHYGGRVNGINGVGGLVGSNRGHITTCYATGIVAGKGAQYGGAGGLVGDNNGSIAQSYTTCSVTGDSAVGGLAGTNAYHRIIESYSTGTVSGRTWVGGLVGFNEYASITFSWSSAVVIGEQCVGGLLGYNDDSPRDTDDSRSPASLIQACFWDTEASGQATSAGGTGKTTTEMQAASTFLEAGWDFVNEAANGTEDRWKIAEGVGYPRLGWEKYSGGTGEPNDPYQIATAADLIALGETPEDYDKHFILTANIDLDPNLPGGRVFDKAVIAPAQPGGSAGPQGIPFAGVFVGKGHTVSHLTIKGDSYLGLFGWSNWAAKIENLGVADVNIVGSGLFVGALVGDNDGSAATQCYSTGSITGGSDVGGLVGVNSGTLTQCYSTAAVSGDGYVGGLAGINFRVVSHCCSTGAVGGSSGVGGLVGASMAPGGRPGTPGTVTASFWDTQTSDQATSDGGTGKTTAEMKTAKTFLDAGWDFVDETANGTGDIWWINEGRDYPRLSWEGPAGIVFVDIPAGMFEMGDHAIAGYRNDQKPVHTVTLDGFQISKYETTNAQYAQFLNAAMADGLIQVVHGVVYASSDASLAQGYCDTYASSPYSQIEYSQRGFSVRSRDGLAMSEHPVARVSWYGAKAFCDYYGYRLPTEAQWEYAARGGYHDPYCRYPWGSDEIDCSKANCKTDKGFCNPLGLTSWPFTVPVGYYGPQGAYGLCDMSGNLWEWCQDWYDAGYYAVSPMSNPAGPETGATRVLRGGAWDVHGNSCDVAGRSIGDPAVRGQVVGFRVCR